MDQTGRVLADPEFVRSPGLLGPIFEEAGTGERQMREGLFLSFNVDLGFFEARLLGPVKATGAAVTVIGDASVFAPDPRSIRGAGHAYTLGLAATAGAFHPKLTILAGPERALVGIGSGNLTLGGWHANEEVLTTIRASRADGAPVILRDVVRFLRDLAEGVTLSPLAAEGVDRTADQLAALVDAAAPVDTGHMLLDSLRGPIIEQLPADPVDALQISAPFHDLGARALATLIKRYAVRKVTVLAQRRRAVMDPEAIQRVARAAGTQLTFVQVTGDEELTSPYRHGKVLTAIRDGLPAWTVIGSPNLSIAALLRGFPSGNVEMAVLHHSSRSLFPAPHAPIDDVAALRYTIAVEGEDATDPPPSLPALLEARSVAGGTEVTLSRPALKELVVEVSPFALSPDDFHELGRILIGDVTATFPEQFGPGTRLRVGDSWQFLALPDQVIRRLQPTGISRPNRDATYADLFASDTAAQHWLDALARLLQSHSGAGRPGATYAAANEDAERVTASWRTLDDEDVWTSYTEDALTRLGMPIFRLATGSPAGYATVGASLPNTAPVWEDRFEENVETFEGGESAESVEDLDEVLVAGPATLSAHQRGRLRRWIKDAVQLMPSVAPYERIALCQLTVVGTTASIWDAAGGTAGWFDPLADALSTMDAQSWPPPVADQAAALTAIGLYRLWMAVPPDERGKEARRFAGLARRLAPLTGNARVETVAANLELLAGTTQVAIEAEDVLSDVVAHSTSDERDALKRVLERVLPQFDAIWLDEVRLLLTGRSTKPRAIAIQALKHAEGLALDRIAIGVSAGSGPWVVVGKVPDRLILVEGGTTPTTYKTYDTRGVLNPVGVLTEPDLGQARRSSTPPWIRPEGVDLEVLDALGLDCSAFGGMLRQG